MNPQDAEPTAGRYLRAAGQSSDQRYQLGIDELVWLLGHCSRLSDSRLALLRVLQSALPSSGEPDLVAELKELLSDVIIMETRVSGRNAPLSELLKELAGSRRLDGVPVDEASLTEVIEAIIAGNSHVQATVEGQT